MQPLNKWAIAGGLFITGLALYGGYSLYQRQEAIYLIMVLFIFIVLNDIGRVKNLWEKVRVKSV